MNKSEGGVSVQKIQATIEKASQVLAVLFLTIATALVTFNVTARYVFNYGVPWCEEAIRYSVIFATFFGLSLAVAKNESMKIDILLQLLKGKGLYVVNLIGTALESMALVALFFFSYSLIRETQATGQITPSTDYPMYIPYIVVTLGVLFCMIRSFGALAEALRKR